jgi:hypothetical protein
VVFLTSASAAPAMKFWLIFNDCKRAPYSSKETDGSLLAVENAELNNSIMRVATILFYM